MIADTLYAKYMKEREGASIIENEHGFIVYKVVGSECFIIEMFVDQSARKSGVARALVERLACENMECTVVTGNIWLKKPGADTVLKASLACGFKVISASGDVLLIAKDLMGGD